VLTDDPLADRLRAAGQADFDERFTIERAADAMIEFYESVISGTRKRGGDEIGS
jgi:hypothetical protein